MRRAASSSRRRSAVAVEALRVSSVSNTGRRLAWPRSCTSIRMASALGRPCVSRPQALALPKPPGWRKKARIAARRAASPSRCNSRCNASLSSAPRAGNVLGASLALSAWCEGSTATARAGAGGGSTRGGGVGGAAANDALGGGAAGTDTGASVTTVGGGWMVAVAGRGSGAGAGVGVRTGVGAGATASGDTTVCLGACRAACATGGLGAITVATVRSKSVLGGVCAITREPGRAGAAGGAGCAAALGARGGASADTGSARLGGMGARSRPSTRLMRSCNSGWVLSTRHACGLWKSMVASASACGWRRRTSVYSFWYQILRSVLPRPRRSSVTRTALASAWYSWRSQATACRNLAATQPGQPMVSSRLPAAQRNRWGRVPVPRGCIRLRPQP